MPMRGNSPSDIACWAIEKAPVMTACEAITVTAVASSTSGITSQPCTIRKNGLVTASGCEMMKAPWPR